ncbi:MAG: hypothetical protein ACI9Y1_001813 [Lentisphaeria bacterium]|jgi:hypothetical protein
MNDAWLNKQDNNRARISDFAIRSESAGVIAELVSPDFSEVFTSGSDEYRVLLYRTQRRYADGETNKDETISVAEVRLTLNEESAMHGTIWSKLPLNFSGSELPTSGVDATGATVNSIPNHLFLGIHLLHSLSLFPNLTSPTSPTSQSESPIPAFDTVADGTSFDSLAYPASVLLYHLQTKHLTFPSSRAYPN